MNKFESKVEIRRNKKKAVHLSIIFLFFNFGCLKKISSLSRRGEIAST